MTIDLDDLEAKARGATHGEWSVEPHVACRALYAGRDDQHHGLRLFNLDDGDSNIKANAAYIVAAQPSAVLELIARVRELEGALRDAQNELFEAADKFNVIHHNHPGSAADLGIGKYQAEDKAFCAELSDRMMAAADRARTALGGSNG